MSVVKKKLTIAIPTFNRANHLKLLLDALRADLVEYKDSLDIVICDNHSTDETEKIISAFKTQFPEVRTLRHSNNVGFDLNFYSCIESVHTKYFWMMGDDDLPRAGLIAQILNLLSREEPDMVYLPSKWMKIADDMSNFPLNNLKVLCLDNDSFARKVNTNLTFISSIIVNFEIFQKYSSIFDLKKYFGTSLLQLGWVLSVLKSGKKFIYVDNVCILATLGNTGGYAVFDVFGMNYCDICKKILGKNSKLFKILLLRNLVLYFPNLIWSMRFSSVGNFQTSVPIYRLGPHFNNNLFFYLVILPLAETPKWIALFFLAITKFYSKIIRLVDKITES